MGTVKKYCIDCGSRLVYYPNYSNPKAPNEHRILTYGCMNCTIDLEEPKMITVKRNDVKDTFSHVRLDIYENKSKNETP